EHKTCHPEGTMPFVVPSRTSTSNTWRRFAQRTLVMPESPAMQTTRIRRTLQLACISLLCAFTSTAQTMRPDAEKQLAREIYKEMIEVQSGFTTGSTTPISEAAAARLKAAGFPDSDIFVGRAQRTKH